MPEPATPAQLRAAAAVCDAQADRLPHLRAVADALTESARRADPPRDQEAGLHGRLHFHRPDGTRAAANSGAPSCLVAYGQRNVEALRACDLPGTLTAWSDLAAKISPPADCNPTRRDEDA